MNTRLLYLSTLLVVCTSRADNTGHSSGSAPATIFEARDLSSTEFKELFCKGKIIEAVCHSQSAIGRPARVQAYEDKFQELLKEVISRDKIPKPDPFPDWRSTMQTQRAMLEMYGPHFRQAQIEQLRQNFLPQIRRSALHDTKIENFSKIVSNLVIPDPSLIVRDKRARGEFSYVCGNDGSKDNAVFFRGERYSADAEVHEPERPPELETEETEVSRRGGIIICPASLAADWNDPNIPSEFRSAVTGFTVGHELGHSIDGDLGAYKKYLMKKSSAINKTVSENNYVE